MSDTGLPRDNKKAMEEIRALQSQFRDQTLSQNLNQEPIFVEMVPVEVTPELFDQVQASIQKAKSDLAKFKPLTQAE
jgi:hypothetical protein